MHNAKCNAYFIFLTIVTLNLRRPIEELSGHIVMSEPRVRDPNSGVRVGFVVTQITNIIICQDDHQVKMINNTIIK